MNQMPARKQSTVTIQRNEAAAEAMRQAEMMAAKAEASETSETSETGETSEIKTEDAKPDLTRCDGRNESGKRQCILNAGHSHVATGQDKGAVYSGTIEENGHVFRSGGKRKEYAPLTGEVEHAGTKGTFIFEDVPDEEEVTGLRETERSEEQQEIDRRVKAAHEDWIKAGKPAEFNTPSKVVDGEKVTVRKRIMFAPGNEATVSHMMDKAARFHNVNVRLVGPRTHESGAKFFFYVVKDKTERQPTGAQTNATTGEANGEPRAADEAKQDQES
jgi:hypothetical protein